MVQTRRGSFSLKENLPFSCNIVFLKELISVMNKSKFDNNIAEDVIKSEIYLHKLLLENNDDALDRDIISIKTVLDLFVKEHALSVPQIEKIPAAIRSYTISGPNMIIRHNKNFFYDGNNKIYLNFSNSYSRISRARYWVSLLNEIHMNLSDMEGFKVAVPFIESSCVPLDDCDVVKHFEYIEYLHDKYLAST